MNLFHVHQTAAQANPKTGLVRVSTPSQAAFKLRLDKHVRGLLRERLMAFQALFPSKILDFLLSKQLHDQINEIIRCLGYGSNNVH